MRIFLVNLDRNPERLAFMSQQLDRLGLPFERVPGVCGIALSPEDRKRMFSPFRSWVASKKWMSAPEIGVALSHVECYRRLLSSGEKAALVLEDDVALSPGIRDALAQVESFLSPKEAQVVTLSGYGVRDEADGASGICEVESFWCADAYCVTASAARLLLDVNCPVITVADSFKRWHRRFGLRLYRFLPTAARQDDVTFPSENKVLPKSGWLLRNLLWVVDWFWCKAERHALRCRKRGYSR